MGKKQPPSGVMCYWEYAPDAREVLSDVMCYWEYVFASEEERWAPSRLWRLMESFPIDGDGYPLTPTSTDNCSDSRHVWNCWLNREVVGEEEGWPSQEPILGRAVTIWTVQSGVGLIDLHPPERVAWLSVGFIEKLRKLPNWHEFLECGHNLYLGTARAAEKILFGNRTIP